MPEGVAAAEGYVTLLRPEEPGDDTQQRRFAAAVGTRNVHPLPGRGFERDAGQHAPIAAPDLDPGRRNPREIRCLQDEDSPASQVARTIAESIRDGAGAVHSVRSARLPLGARGRDA